MDLESFLEDTPIKVFNCDLCNTILSQFPIYLTSDSQNVCGRCTPPQEKLHLRNKIYEHLSKSIKFPCRYKNRGCVEDLVPEKVPEHENLCKFRTIQCFLMKCKWEGPYPDFLEHCNDNHFDLFLMDKETFEVNLSKPFHITKLLENKDKLIVSEIKFDLDEKKVHIAFYHPKHVKTGLDKTYLYQLSLKTATMELMARFEATSFDETNFTDLHLDFKETIVKCMISLEKPTSDPEDEKQLNDYLLSVLKCSSCKTYALPPISQCAVAQIVLCSTCKQKHSNCVNCGLDQDKNIALNKMAELLNYPCKYKKRGCDFVAVPPEMEKHLELCQYKTVTCPLLEFVKCDWKGYGKNIATHIQSGHQALVPEGSEFSGTFRLQAGYSVLKRGERFFLLSYGIDHVLDEYYWSVQTLHGERDKVFEHQIEIFSSDLPDALLMRRPCQRKKNKYYVNVGLIKNASFRIRVL